MFQNRRPALSNRFHPLSSTISIWSCFIASVTLRVPLSNARCSLSAPRLRQQAHNGSRPHADLGTTTSERLASALSRPSIRQSSHAEPLVFAGRHHHAHFAANAAKQFPHPQQHLLAVDLRQRLIPPKPRAPAPRQYIPQHVVASLVCELCVLSDLCVESLWFVERWHRENSLSSRTTKH